MTKRTIEQTDTAYSIPKLQSQGQKRFKRRRTEEVVLQLATYHCTLRTLAFLEASLAAIEVHENDADDPDHPSLNEIRERLRIESDAFKTNHEDYCQRIKHEAIEVQRVKDSYTQFSTALGEDKESTCYMLQLGVETSALLCRRISQYAGVASNSECDEWSSILPRLDSPRHLPRMKASQHIWSSNLWSRRKSIT